MNNRVFRDRYFLLAGWLLLAHPAGFCQVDRLRQGETEPGGVDHFMAGRACMVQEYYDSAVYHLEMALQENPGETETLLHLGTARFASGNYPGARDAFYEAERRRRGSASLQLARTEAMLHHPELAMKYLKEHLDSRHRVTEKEILLDEALQRLEGLPGWQQFWNEKEWYSQEDKEFQEALFLGQTGNGLEAINILNRLEKQGYRRSEVLEQKAAIYRELGNMKAARSAYASALKSDVRNLDALMELSRIQVSEGEMEDALRGLDRLIRQAPDRFEAYPLRAEARSATGDLTGAVGDMDLYLTYFPEDDRALYRKGMIQFSHGRYLDAIHSFNRALKMDSGNADYYLARGRTYAATGTIMYADRDMSMALDLDPYNGQTWYEKGMLADRLGNRQAACRCFRKALQYGVFEAREWLETNCRGTDGTGPGQR